MVNDKEEREKIRAIRKAHYAKQAGKSESKPQAVKAESTSEKQFDLSGNWMKARADVKAELGLESVPESKGQARELLESAGYTVSE